MQYLISFLEGIITFISPCLLPMLPIYISYFAAGKEENDKSILLSSFGFVLGFTLVFVSMGALAGTIGSFLKTYQTAVNIVSGIIVCFFGLNFLGIFKVNFFKGDRTNFQPDNLNFTRSIIFGFVFSIGWTPCVGAFLGSALMMASQEGSMVKGMIMLLCYSLGLGIPFIFSAVLINKLKSTFDFIKRNYNTINTVSGTLLIIIGISMATGMFGKFLSLFS